MTRFSWMILALIILILLFILLQRSGRLDLGGKIPGTEKVLVQAEATKEKCDPSDFYCKLKEG